MQYFVLCIDEAQNTVSAIALVGEVFPGCFSSDDRFIAVHSFANSASHPRFSLFPNNLITEKGLAGIPIRYLSTPTDLLTLQEELSREGWIFRKSENDAVVARRIQPTKIGDDSYDYGDNENWRPKVVALKDEFLTFLIRLAARKNMLSSR